jgi:hypothetical protein
MMYIITIKDKQSNYLLSLTTSFLDDLEVATSGLNEVPLCDSHLNYDKIAIIRVEKEAGRK